jgi:hypothetical protein
VREATLAGRVLDERTGAPMAGARVWALRRQDPEQGTFGVGNEPPESAVTTAPDGSFVLTQLGEGEWTVRHRHRERPKPVPVDVTLRAEEQRQGLELRLPPGARVAGRVTGLPLPAGSKVFLHPIAAPRFGGHQSWITTGQNAIEGRVPLGTDGAFAFEGVALTSVFVVLELPSPPRCGGPLVVAVEPLRVRGDLQREFDAGLDAPGRIRGVVTWPKAVPTGAVPVVVAEQVGDNPDDQVFRNHAQFPGPRAFVQADGSFVVPVVRGTHVLRVVDAATGVSLATDAERLVVPAGGEIVRALSVPLVEVAVELQPPTDAGPFVWVDRLEVRHQPAKNDRNAIGGGNDDYDAGLGLPVRAGETSLRLWLPAGKVVLLVRGSAGNLRSLKERGRGTPLAREEFELRADETPRRELTLQVGPPADVDAPAPKDDADVEAGKD